MSIEKMSSELVSTFNNSQNSMGVMKLSEKEQIKNLHSIPLTSQLGYFYNHITLEDTPTFGGDFFIQLFEVEQLDEALDGWKQLVKYSKDPSWSENYIIFA